MQLKKNYIVTKISLLGIHLRSDPSIVYVSRDPCVNTTFFTLLRAVTSDSNLDAIGNHRTSTIPLKKKVITLKIKSGTRRLEIISKLKENTSFHLLVEAENHIYRPNYLTSSFGVGWNGA